MSMFSMAMHPAVFLLPISDGLAEPWMRLMVSTFALIEIEGARAHGIVEADPACH